MSAALKEAPRQAPPGSENHAFNPGIKIDINTRPAQLPSKEAAKEQMYGPKMREFEPGPNVCVHELTHAIIAEFYKFDYSVSVEPDGPSLGRVIVNGPMTRKQFLVFAASSSVDFEKYTPAGTGSDLAQIERSGGSVNSAAIEARTIIMNFIRGDVEMLHEAAWVLHERRTTGNIHSLFHEAERRVKQKRGEHTDSPSFFRPPKPEEKPEQPQTSPFQTWLEELTEDRQRAIKFVDGVKIREETKCKLCGGINGHLQICDHYKKPENPFAPESPKSENPFEKDVLHPLFSPAAGDIRGDWDGEDNPDTRNESSDDLRRDDFLI